VISAVVALVIYVAAAFMPDGETHYGIFKDKEACLQAIAEARSQGIFTSECAEVKLTKVKNSTS
jgi:hypothetical protein